MELDSNFFRLMGVPQQYSVDQHALKKRSRELLRQYHPDRFAAATPQEQRMAVQFTSHINMAIAVLRDPVRRAIHMFELQGGVIDSQRTTLSDPEFLMRQMALREEIEEAGRAGDTNRLEQLKHHVAEAADKCQRVFDVAGDGEQDLVRWADAIAKLQFYQKLEGEINAMCSAGSG